PANADIRRACIDDRASESAQFRFCHAPVAQLDRAPGYELGGRRFESFRARQAAMKNRPQGRFFHARVQAGRLPGAAAPSGLREIQPWISPAWKKRVGASNPASASIASTCPGGSTATSVE